MGNEKLGKSGGFCKSGFTELFAATFEISDMDVQPSRARTLDSYFTKKHLIVLRIKQILMYFFPDSS